MLKKNNIDISILNEFCYILKNKEYIYDFIKSFTIKKYLYDKYSKTLKTTLQTFSQQIDKQLKDNKLVVSSLTAKHKEYYKNIFLSYKPKRFFIINKEDKEFIINCLNLYKNESIKIKQNNKRLNKNQYYYRNNYKEIIYILASKFSCSYHVIYKIYNDSISKNDDYSDEELEKLLN